MNPQPSKAALRIANDFCGRYGLRDTPEGGEILKFLVNRVDVEISPLIAFLRLPQVVASDAEILERIALRDSLLNSAE